VTDLVEIALFTDDVAATTAFYRALVGTDPVSEWPGGAIFAVGCARILVHERAAGIGDGPPNEDHVALGVVDVHAACAALRAGGHAVVVEPRAYAWGRSAYLRDPDGRLVELTVG
jgi:catechol 2,3-dioxygenase-like lactoylglutathione lyase family enzyme